MSDKYELNDLVHAAISQKPTDFNNIFNDIIINKIDTAISNKKLELAQDMFMNNNSNEEDFNSEEEIDG